MGLFLPRSTVLRGDETHVKPADHYFVLRVLFGKTYRGTDSLVGEDRISGEFARSLPEFLLMHVLSITVKDPSILFKTVSPLKESVVNIVAIVAGWLHLPSRWCNCWDRYHTTLLPHCLVANRSFTPYHRFANVGSNYG